MYTTLIFLMMFENENCLDAIQVFLFSIWRQIYCKFWVNFFFHSKFQSFLSKCKNQISFCRSQQWHRISSEWQRWEEQDCTTAVALYEREFQLCLMHFGEKMCAKHWQRNPIKFHWDLEKLQMKSELNWEPSRPSVFALTAQFDLHAPLQWNILNRNLTSFTTNFLYHSHCTRAVAKVG